MDDTNNYLKSYIEKYNSKFAVEPSINKSAFFKLPKRYNLDELLCVRFEKTINNTGVFSVNNSKFQILDKRLPPKTKVQIYLSQKISMIVKSNNKVYDVKPLELISFLVTNFASQTSSSIKDNSFIFLSVFIINISVNSFSLTFFFSFN